MLFNSPVFLFYFLPIAFVLHWCAPASWRNSVLLFLSLVFYWWGGSSEIVILFVSIALNWVCGLVIGLSVSPSVRVPTLAFGVSANLLILTYYKYFNLFYKTLFGHHTVLQAIIIPLGISFYTFHAISCLVDLYRGKKRPFVNPVDFGLYITLFPQLIAGPIVRFHDIADQIVQRSLDWDRLCFGSERFIFGLGKKVLLADPLGSVADPIFDVHNIHLSTPHAWLGLLCFTLQIYYDFSGYSDMAIGLAYLFGFKLLENFNYPYLADSITDFWHRWHLSLSAWFRDYLYIPLGGNRGSALATYLNLFLVFLLCGFWHGANWNFVLWGAYNGAFLVLEKRINLKSYLPAAVLHLYALLVVMLGWVLFRTSSPHSAIHFVSTLFGLHGGSSDGDGVALVLSDKVCTTFVFALVIALPVFGFLASDFRLRRFPNKATHLVNYPAGLLRALEVHPLLVAATRAVACLAVFILSLSEIAGSTSHSFIYFHF